MDGRRPGGLKERKNRVGDERGKRMSVLIPRAVRCTCNVNFLMEKMSRWK